MIGSDTAVGPDSRVGKCCAKHSYRGPSSPDRLAHFLSGITAHTNPAGALDAWNNEGFTKETSATWHGSDPGGSLFLYQCGVAFECRDGVECPGSASRAAPPAGRTRPRGRDGRGRAASPHRPGSPAGTALVSSLATPPEVRAMSLAGMRPLPGSLPGSPPGMTAAPRPTAARSPPSG